MKLIKKVSQNWKKMDGSSLLEKKINAYLCSTYIFDNEAPSDECLSYAKKFAKINKLDDKSRYLISKTIKEYFFTAHDIDGKVYLLKDKNNSIEKSTNDIINIIKRFRLNEKK